MHWNDHHVARYWINKQRKANLIADITCFIGITIFLLMIIISVIMPFLFT